MLLMEGYRKIMNQNVFESVDRYISDLFAHQDDALIAALRATEKANISKINVSSNQGKLLHILAKLCNAKKILEIGTLGGYSTIWLARALPDNGHIITLEMDPSHANVAQNNIFCAGLASRVEIRIGKALDLLPKIKAEGIAPFDMIFIDADNPPMAEYLQWALLLSRPGTLIVADNVIREDKTLDKNCHDEKVVGAQRFNKLLSESPTVTATLIQTIGARGQHGGMAIAVVN